MGDGRGKILENGQLLTLSLDKFSGSGFQSRNEYLFGKIDMNVELVPDNSAGTVTTYYLRSQGSTWDEIDFEFLGTFPANHTRFTRMCIAEEKETESNSFIFGSIPLKISIPTLFFGPIPTLFFGTLDASSSLSMVFRSGSSRTWNPSAFRSRKSQPMRLYSSLWNADDWATRGGLIKTD
ncbi:putative xyloglucan endotransglucosylase/hydrolase protein 23 [Hibiscus syriacus]|uniref:Xyloglucan endotransglucosylase/hydrolase protein 23 n=1 Tax=Hibiscus syriacus TaxID=106335 RepID=A0A6A2XDQ2_HIBSY|nr:putative xyloglucan endotransglucosylase/hydrolase protein 23 [Hibiscus syriacus]